MALPVDGLHALELSYHALDVRPRLTEFVQLLNASSGLEKLVMNVSGPLIDDQLVGLGERTDRPITLLALREVALGYADVSDACRVLNLLNAPNVRMLNLEDDSNPVDVGGQDAASLLLCCGMGGIWPLGMANTTGGYVDVDPTRGSVQPLFPQLEEVTLRKVMATMGPFRTFFGSLPKLQRLSLDHTSMDALEALSPDGSSGEICCPCPELKSIHVLGLTSDKDAMINDIARKRAERGLRFVVVDIRQGEGLVQR
jgi:hypothetical protein